MSLLSITSLNFKRETNSECLSKLAISCVGKEELFFRCYIYLSAGKQPSLDFEKTNGII